MGQSSVIYYYRGEKTGTAWHILLLVTGELSQPQSTKTECDYLNGWIKKRSHTQKSHPKVVNPRDLAGERKKKKKKKNLNHICMVRIDLRQMPENEDDDVSGLVGR